ncbi:hypothetical protein AB1L07_02555 [Niallia alba]|uniref:hypothetical protein n=1 Tax=Niallia alba TaxID=2729105 RepID=UPI0039A21AB3
MNKLARKCTCQICKTKGFTDSFYKVTDDKGKNKYYCSQLEYESYTLEKEKRNNLMKFIAEEVLGYEVGQIVPPVLIKKIGTMNQFYDYEVIQKCFEVNKETIEYWLNNKNFTSEYGMISYILKIIEGNINDIHKQWKYHKQQTITIENTDLDVNIINQIETIVPKTKPVDNGILDFLDDNDL